MLAMVPLPSLAGAPETDCDIDRGACTRPLADTGITAAFELLPRPVQVMRNLSCRVVLQRGGVPVTDRAVRVRFTMPGMYMAENAVALRHAGGGRYEGTAVIVRCPTGSNLWRADVRVRSPSDPIGRWSGVSYTFRLN